MEKNMSVTIAGDVLCDIVSGFLQGIGVHCYIDGIDAAPGGATGLSILLNRITGLPIGMLTIWINLPLMVASWILLGRSRTVKTVKTVLICNAIIDLAVTPYLPVYTGNRFMACIIGGVLVGIGMAIVFMSGSTTGGSDIGAKLIQKYFPHIQTGTALMVLDLIIIGTSILMFRNIESGLYGMISTVVTSYVIDMTLYGLNRSTMMTVVTPFSDKIADVLMEYLDRGCTLLECRGAYSKKASGVTLCVVDRKQMYKAKKLIYQIDPKAFLIVSEAREVYGEGFLASDQE
ncbi:YitT family protein [Pilosibacter sp. HC1M1C21]|uniref:YitT family protein n=1 Tax=Pilosibacter sp. HC1M1C21 TaxID=3378803 RepID=UPI00385E7E32